MNGTALVAGVEDPVTYVYNCHEEFVNVLGAKLNGSIEASDANARSRCFLYRSRQ
ncbi:MAG: hypothetical protein FWB90_01340 [Fibromonadales bacterium]|nr:hypothetical protein [Fibromonadales bacterium]